MLIPPTVPLDKREERDEDDVVVLLLGPCVGKKLGTSVVLGEGKLVDASTLCKLVGDIVGALIGVVEGDDVVRLVG